MPPVMLGPWACGGAWRKSPCQSASDGPAAGYAPRIRRGSNSGDTGGPVGCWGKGEMRRDERGLRTEDSALFASQDASKKQDHKPQRSMWRSSRRRGICRLSSEMALLSGFHAQVGLAPTVCLRPLYLPVDQAWLVRSNARQRRGHDAPPDRAIRPFRGRDGLSAGSACAPGGYSPRSRRRLT